MSLISKQIEELRSYAKERKGELAKLTNDAADTIEMLSAKLHASQMELSSQYYNNGWLPVDERKPDNEHDDWVIGQIREKSSGYLWIPSVVEYRESKDDWYVEGIGWLKSNPDDAFEVIAWMPLPKKYVPKEK